MSNKTPKRKENSAVLHNIIAVIKYQIGMARSTKSFVFIICWCFHLVESSFQITLSLWKRRSVLLIFTSIPARQPLFLLSQLISCGGCAARPKVIFVFTSNTRLLTHNCSHESMVCLGLWGGNCHQQASGWWARHYDFIWRTHCKHTHQKQIQAARAEPTDRIRSKSTHTNCRSISLFHLNWSPVCFTHVTYTLT